MKRNTAEKLVIITFTTLVILVISSFIKSEIAYSATTHLVISEIQFMGDNGANDEFIELYNPTDNPIDISTWSIQRETATESPTFTKKNFTSPAIVPDHGYYLIAHTSYNGSVTADMSHSSFTLTSSGATLFLVNDQVLLTTGNEESVVDKVAIGVSALNAEGSPFSTVPESEQSIERVGDDTDNNSTDFILQENPSPQNSELTPTQTGTVTPAPTDTYPTPTTQPSPSSGNIVINEVAWAGTIASADDEWIELYNTSENNIDLTDWTLTAIDGTPSINFEGSIPAKGFYLLERSNDDTVKDISANQTYNGALGNSGETLELRDSQGLLIDTANFDGGGWPGGNSTERKSMERINPSLSDRDDNWATNDGVIINGIDEVNNNILGTPKNQNSVYHVVSPSPTPTGIASPTLTFNPSSTPTPKPTSTATPTPQITPSPSPTPTPNSFIIAQFTLPGKTITCTLSFKIRIAKFFIIMIPHISCK